MLGVNAGMFGVPNDEVAAAMVDKVTGIGTYLTELADRLRLGIATGRVAPAFSVMDTLAQLDDPLTTPAAENPAISRAPRRR